MDGTSFLAIATIPAGEEGQGGEGEGGGDRERGRGAGVQGCRKK